MTCGNGALQSRGTCWFFSIINGFLLSDAGQKILFDHLEHFYKGLDSSEKAYFDDPMNAPCPLKADIIKTKRIYFYKFLDQYLCFRSGPRSVSAKMGKSANILGGASLAGTLAKQNAGGQGAFPQEELPKILKHLGITGYVMTNQYAHMPVADARRRPHFLVAVAPKTTLMVHLPTFRPLTYSKMCCSITIGNSKAPNSLQHKFHAITGYMCNGKGYLFDSNQRKQFPCDWWNYLSLRKVVNEEVALFYDFFAGGQINFLAYNFVIFSRNDYIESIKPVCRLKYKKTKTPNLHNSYFGRKNLANALNTEEFARFKFNPAQIAALKRKIARGKPSPGPILNKEAFNDILKTTSNKYNAIQKVVNLENAGYRVNQQAYNNFREALGSRNKPKSASPENVFITAREMMSMATTKSKRALIYSSIYKNVPMHERKVLAYFRDHGLWHARNYFKKNSPSVKPPIKRKPKANSPATARRKEVLERFKPFWNSATSNNHKTIRNYIAAYKSPSPVKANRYANALKNLNSLKTAKARAEWLKAKKLNFKKDEMKGLRNYVKNKNQANRNRRAAKKA
jgi:hypothetical protein